MNTNKNTNTKYTKNGICLLVEKFRVNNNQYSNFLYFSSLSAKWQAGIRGIAKLTGLIVFMLLISVVANAQPTPPSSPGGTPVPVENLMGLLPAVFLAFGIIRLRKGKRAS